MHTRVLVLIYSVCTHARLPVNRRLRFHYIHCLFILSQADALGLGDRLVVDVHTDGFHGVEAAGEVWKEKATESWSVLNPKTFVLYAPMVFKSQSIVQV